MAHALADWINPLLLLLLLIAPFVGPRPDRPWPFWGKSALGIGLAVLLAELGKAIPIWPGHPTFPSGHETLAVAIAACLALRDPRWLWPALPLVLVLGWALVAAHYHRPVDVLGALLTGLLPVLLVHALWRLPTTRRQNAPLG